MIDHGIFDLSGRKALVTGATGGIGRACALGLARAGADVALVDLKEGDAAGIIEVIEALGRRASFFQCDVTKVEQVDRTVSSVAQEFGRLDIACNLAGVVGEPAASIDDAALATWAYTMDVNLNATFYCCRSEAKHMIPQGYGRIVNTASISASVINRFPPTDNMMAAYCVSKAAVKHLTKALAMEWLPHNVHVNCISPGYVATPMTQFVQETPELLEDVHLITPMGRLARPEEMVGGLLYLVSDAASFTTGSDLLMDGGYTVW